MVSRSFYGSSEPGTPRLVNPIPSKPLRPLLPSIPEYHPSAGRRGEPLIDGIVSQRANGQSCVQGAGGFMLRARLQPGEAPGPRLADSPRPSRSAWRQARFHQPGPSRCSRALLGGGRRARGVMGFPRRSQSLPVFPERLCSLLDVGEVALDLPGKPRSPGFERHTL